MTEQKGINRRDFLKIGGFAAGTLVTATVVKQIDNVDILAAEEEYGGFYVRRHTIEDPPYKLDPAIYQRKDGTNTSFTRSMGLLDMQVNQDRNILDKRPGSDRLAYAFSDGASAFMYDMQFYNMEQTLFTTHQSSPYPRWIPEEEGYTLDEVTDIVKYAAKFFGGSAVGIVETKERYFYSRVGGPTSLAGKEFIQDPRAIQAGLDPEKIQEIIPDILASMDPDTFKEMLLNSFENMDPDTLPPTVNLEMLENMSGEMLQNMLPQMMGSMDPAMMQQMMPAMMEHLDPSTMDPTLIMPALDMRKMTIATADEIEFSDEIDTPMHEDGRMVFPTSMNRIIAIGIEQDYEQLQYHGATVVAGAAIGDGYSRMATTAVKLATFIRSLGYNAVAMGNNTGLSTPIAIDAGLGELGRNSLLISPKYGPRLRLCKVITDLPLNVDAPISFGVTEFCEVCGKCAELCPSGSIPKGERTYDAPESGTPGLLHWPVEGDKCFAFWVESGIGCSNCIRVCPFTKPEGWLHDATKILIGAKVGPLDSLLLKLDDASGYGPEEGPDTHGFWNDDTFMHIKS